MTSIQLTLLTAYLLPSSMFLTNWLKFFKQKNNLSPEESLLAFILLLITTILWPLLLSHYCLEFLQTKIPKQQIGYVMPIISVVVMVGVLTVSSFVVSSKIIVNELTPFLLDSRF